MTAMVLPIQHRPNPDNASSAVMEVNVFLQATVIAPDVARRKANVWLSMNAGHLLMAEDPELVLDDPLQWRFAVVRSRPNLDKPGTVQRSQLGRLQMNAGTGEILHPESLIQD
ncbi:hypothetical protein GC175_32480 [bacterium]|nr:hypothetical protein [bacterium]